MNITSMINSLSEETIISAAIFVGAGLIYILRKFSFLNLRIAEYELADSIGREYLENDLMTMKGVEDNIRFEIKSSRDNVEEELVQHELRGLNMAPRLHDLGKQIADVLDDQSDSLIDVDKNISFITSRLSRISNINSESQVGQFNSMIPKLVSKLEEVDNSVKVESNRVSTLLHEVTMIKRAIGVE